MHVLKEKLLWFAAAALVLFMLYVTVDLIGRRLRREAVHEAPEA